jgi:hypothetical protein
MNFGDIRALSSLIVGIVTAIIISIPNIVIFIQTKMYKKKDTYNRRLKEDGIERTAARIAELKHEKIKEEKRLAREEQDILYAELFNLHCNALEVDSNSMIGRLLKSYLNELKAFTYELIVVAIYNNSLSSKTGMHWNNYRSDKIKYILTSVIEYGRKIYDGDIFGVSYEKVCDDIKNETKFIFDKHLSYIFDGIKSVSVEYDNEISELKKVLNGMKGNE